MTAFIVSAILLTVAAVALVTWPLVSGATAPPGPEGAALNATLLEEESSALEREHREGRLADTAYAQARDELARRVLQDAQPDAGARPASTPALRTFAVVALLLPLVAGLLYAVRGTPEALLPGAVLAGAGAQGAPAGTPPAPDARTMVASLAARLARDPDNPAGWALLGRSYTVMGRYDDAVQAYARIGPTLDQNADWLAGYARAEAMRAGGNPVGRPEELARRALRADPRNLLALMLASYGAAARGDFAAALPTIERGLEVAPPDSEGHRLLQDLLTRSRDAESPAHARSGLPAGQRRQGESGGATRDP